MWKKLRPMLPHAAILSSNMYAVLFVVNHINPSMNFIDNGLTKGLLLILSALAVWNWRASVADERRRARARARKGLKPLPANPARRAIPAAGAAACSVCVALLLLDRIRPGLSLFLKEPVQWIVLAGGLATNVAGAVLASENRARLRRRTRRQKG